MRENADLVFTYDRGEAERYNLLLDSNRTYNTNVRAEKPASFDNDVFFVGYAKDRLTDIVEIHRFLTENGIRCDFRVLGVPKNSRDYRGLEYLDEPIPYAENLRLIERSACLLEVAQSGSDSATLRVPEAVAYSRKLLSNVPTLQKEDYYNPAQMSVFDRATNIDLRFLRAPMDYTGFSSLETLAPAMRIRLYEEKLRELD